MSREESRPTSDNAGIPLDPASPADFIVDIFFSKITSFLLTEFSLKLVREVKTFIRLYLFLFKSTISMKDEKMTEARNRSVFSQFAARKPDDCDKTSKNGQ